MKTNGLHIHKPVSQKIGPLWQSFLLNPSIYPGGSFLSTPQRGKDVRKIGWPVSHIVPKVQHMGFLPGFPFLFVGLVSQKGMIWMMKPSSTSVPTEICNILVFNDFFLSLLPLYQLLWPITFRHTLTICICKQSSQNYMPTSTTPLFSFHYSSWYL